MTTTYLSKTTILLEHILPETVSIAFSGIFLNSLNFEYVGAEVISSE